MSYLLLLLIFWQPIYWLAKCIYLKFIKKDSNSDLYYTEFVGWFKNLWNLVRPSASVL